MSGQTEPKSKEWTCTELMNRGSVICWNLSWMNSRILSARASPSGPEVMVSHLMSTDISCSDFHIASKSPDVGKQEVVQGGSHRRRLASFGTSTLLMRHITCGCAHTHKASAIAQCDLCILETSRVSYCWSVRQTLASKPVENRGSSIRALCHSSAIRASIFHYRHSTQVASVATP
jgi:hypothetical protein